MKQGAVRQALIPCSVNFLFSLQHAHSQNAGKAVGKGMLVMQATANVIP